MTMTLRSCALIALASTLAACGSDKSGTSGASGSNEVLKGTISDEMIPYDKLRSQPPAAKIVTAGTGSPDGDAGRAASKGEATTAAQPTGSSESDTASSREKNSAATPAKEAE